jgi:hypothetical protein
MVHCYRTLKDSLHMPPAARGHDECFCTAPNFMHIFDHTVKPVLLYASEIVGLFNNNKNVGVNSNNDSHFISNLCSRNPLEKLNISMGKYVLLNQHGSLLPYIKRFSSYASRSKGS